MSQSSFTVFFEDPFWVGVYQRVEDGRLSVCKVTFGAEPRDGEVYQLLLSGWHRLRFGPAVAGEGAAPAPKNPKRARRAAARQLAVRGVGTKAQQALAAARQAGKEAAKTQSRAQKQAEAAARYARRAQKKKEKHRGH